MSSESIGFQVAQIFRERNLNRIVNMKRFCPCSEVANTKCFIDKEIKIAKVKGIFVVDGHDQRFLNEKIFKKNLSQKLRLVYPSWM